MSHNPAVENSPVSLDRTDRDILRLLQAEGRLGGAEIGRRVTLSQPAVSARIKRLEDAGVITGYHAEIDPRRLGFAIHAVARLRTTQASVAPALEMFTSLPEVTLIYRLTGEDCFLLDLHAANAERLEIVVDSIARFGPVTTSLVLRSYPASAIVP
jgi:Lrp/AsnC family transcriptional regulator, leucine-responsive regulatory protein